MGTPPRDISEIESLAAAGLTMAEIGREVGLTRERVRQLCRKHGIETHHYGALTPQEIDRVTECAEQDMRFDETVEATGISAWRVLRIAKHIGHKWNKASRRILDICDRIRPLAAQGLSLGEIGTIVGLSEKHVQSLDVKYGLGVRRKPNRPGAAGMVPREEFVALVKSGLSGQEIADRIGVSVRAVYVRKSSLGLTRGRARHV